MSSSISSSSNTIKPEWLCQVFISFRFRDYDAKSVIEKLGTELQRYNIQTNSVHPFEFENEQDTLPFSQLQSIEASRVSIIVFTKRYGGSRRCLQELEKILECHRAMGQVVFPVFFGVDAKEVCKQSGEFGEEFEGLINRASVEKNTELSWRRALSEATFFSGPNPDNWQVVSGTMDFEYIFGIRDISRFVYKILAGEYLFLLCHPVGIHVRVEDVCQCLTKTDHLRVSIANSAEDVLLNLEVDMIAIWGIEGVGKTTLVKAIYNSMSDDFEASVFLTNISSTWHQKNFNDFHEKEKQLSDIFIPTDMIINKNSNGTEKMLTHRKALVVLDDVTKMDLVMILFGICEWFAPGSLILITTRDKDVIQLQGVKHKYELKPMNNSESLELFSWHAFKHFDASKDLIQLAKKAVKYTRGVPLIVEVLGSIFFDKTISQWRSVLKQLGQIRDLEIMKILKLGYDFLDDFEKDIFVAIVHAFIGKDRHHVAQSLKNSGLDAELGIRNLINWNLLKVDENNKLQMHDLLQEMGRKISHSKPKPKWIHDVFLSFRGEDTRRAFTSHLYAAFKNASIEIYMDDKLERGENISSSLLQAIEDARIAIIIFSINYANSSWCLQEVEKIMECHRTIRQEVIPVFYGVEPSEVRNQTGTFGKNLEGLVKRISAKEDKIFCWKRALTEAANLSGWNLSNYRTESELIDNILKTVAKKLEDGTHLFVADHPVGLESRVQEVIQLLSGKSNEIVIVGIVGMGGSGKTALAKTLYNEVNQNFEGKIFLENIREIWGQEKGKVYLQNQLLSGILKGRRIKLRNIESRKLVIKETLCNERALVILDDLNDVEQLKALCGGRDWLGQGSRLIITTRDERLLNFLKVDNIHRVRLMEESESLELFSWCAFKQATPTPDFVTLSKRVVAYSGRLPLALEVLGSYLFERTILEWESALSKLEVIPNDQIQKKLKISYDGLSDDIEREIFLDICCFFLGKDRNYVTQILNSCGRHAEIGITILIERSLIKVDKNNKLEMHELLQAMGR